MTVAGFGGAGRYADGVYNRNAPGAQNSSGEAYVSGRGYSSNEERLLSEALAAQTVPAELIRDRALAKPNLFPPRFGYDRPPLGIRDVISVDRRYPDSSAQFSGTSGSFSGSATPSLGWW